MNKDSKLKEIFRQEALGHLADIESALLDLEESPDDAECIRRLFRAMHTLKGSGAMFGFDDIAAFSHHAETVLDKVREGAVPVTGDLVDLIFMAKDQIKAMLYADQTENGVNPTACDQIVSKLHQLMQKQPGDADACTMPSGLEVDPGAGRQKEMVYRIRFRPPPNMMKFGMDPAVILNELRDIGHCDVMGDAGAVPPLAALEPENIYFSWDLFLTTDCDINRLKNIFVFVEDGSDIQIQTLGCDVNLNDADRPRLGEILVNRGDVSEEIVDKTLKGQRRIGEMLVAAGNVSGTKVESALFEQKIFEKCKNDINAETIRIPSDKLDKLINLVGEIVVAQSQMSLLADKNGDSAFAMPVKQMDRLTTDLRDFTLNLRMLPVGTLFNRFRRLVRDLSAELGKDVGLVLEGGQTELDKTILDRLHDPLVHLIRNSIDHGQRSPEERERHGKPRKGVIRLSADHRGARVNITVADDGMGIDTAMVRARAVERGLIVEDRRLSEHEIQDLIFTPGFSTARKITCVSGRGVGLDVVRQEINSLGGAIRIQSAPGQGATFHLSLPLTLAIIEGLHVKVDGRDFVIPISQVETCGKMEGLSQDQSETHHMIQFKNELLPAIRLRTFFKIAGRDSPVEYAAAVQAGRHRIAIIVDEVLGNVQTVIKPLDPIYRLADAVSGAAVLGNGAIALVIDLPVLIRCAKAEKSSSVAKHISATA